MAKENSTTPEKSSQQGSGNGNASGKGNAQANGGDKSGKAAGNGGNGSAPKAQGSGGSDTVSVKKAKADSDGGLKGSLKKSAKDSMISDSGKATNPNQAGDANGGGAAAGAVEEVEQPSKTPRQRVKQAKRAGKAGASGAKGYAGVAILSKFMNAAQGIAAMAANAVANTLGFFAQLGAAVVGFVQGAISAVGGFFAGIGSALAGFLGISATAATVVSGAGIIVLAAVVAVGSVTVIANNNIAQKDSMVADCADSVLSYGIGEGEIPETLGDFRIGYTTTWEATLEWMDAHISSGTNQRNVVDMVKEDYTYDDGGFVRFGNYYIVAIAPTPFGTSSDVDARVGDYITFYLSDGTAIECIVGDTKGDVSGTRTDGKDGGKYDFRNLTDWDEIVPINTPTGPATISAYGHTYGNDVNVLEFWGKVSENNHFEKITGKTGLRVASFTNHGYAQEYVDYMNKNGKTLSETASSASSSASANARGSSKDDCVKTRQYDNSSIAAAAVSYAYPTADEAKMNDGTALYQKVHQVVFPGDDYYQSCDRSVATAIVWSGADTSCPPGACSNLISYFDSSERWKKVGDEDSMESTDLQPGDIVICDSHVSMYVGEELIQQIHGDDATPGANSVSGSIGADDVNRAAGSRSPGCDTSAADYIDGKYDSRFYYVYRCVNPENSDQYAHAGD